MLYFSTNLEVHVEFDMSILHLASAILHGTGAESDFPNEYLCLAVGTVVLELENKEKDGYSKIKNINRN